METSEILIGNICSLGAMITDGISGTRKNPRHILGAQLISQFFYGAGSFVLKGYSSTAQNVVSVLRNLAAMKNVKSKAVEWGLILLGVVLGAAFNNRGLIGWLPVIANLEYSVAVFRLKDSERGLKLAFLINAVMFAVFNLSIMNYVGAIGSLSVIVITAVSLLRNKPARNV